MMLVDHGSHRGILHRVIDKATRCAPHRSDRRACDGEPMLTFIAGGAL